MKVSKKLNTKLTLKKETIADLMNAEMKGIKGGSNFTDKCGGFTAIEACSWPFNCNPI